jgi:MFS family permease
VAWSSGKALGFLAGGFLLAAFGFRTTFLSGAVLVALAFLILPKSETPKISDPGLPNQSLPIPPGNFSPSLRQTFRHMAWLANLTAYGGAGVLGHHLPKWFAQFDWPESKFGLFLGAIFLVQTFTFFLLAGFIRFTYSPRWLLLPQVGAGIALLSVPLWNSFGIFLGLAPILGLAFGISYAGSLYYSLDTLASRGWYAGIHEALVGAGGFLPPLLGGLLATWWGWLGAPYLLAGLGILLSVCLQGQLWRRFRKAFPTIDIGDCPPP